MKSMRLILAIALTIAASLLAGPQPADCAWCPTYACYSAGSCGLNCFCLFSPGSGVGSCYSTRARLAEPAQDRIGGR